MRREKPLLFVLYPYRKPTQVGEERILRQMCIRDREYSPRLRYILEESQNEAVQLASEKVGTEHLLLAAGIDPKEYMENQKDGETVGGIIDQYSTDLTLSLIHI